MYASFLRISRALHLAVSQQPLQRVFFDTPCQREDRRDFDDHAKDGVAALLIIFPQKRRSLPTPILSTRPVSGRLPRCLAPRNLRHSAPTSDVQSFSQCPRICRRAEAEVERCGVPQTCRKGCRHHQRLPSGTIDLRPAPPLRAPDHDSTLPL